MQALGFDTFGDCFRHHRLHFWFEMSCLKVIICCALAVCSVNARVLDSRYDGIHDRIRDEFDRPYFWQHPTVPPTVPTHPTTIPSHPVISTEQTTTEFQGKEFGGHSDYTFSQNGVKRYIISEEKLPWMEAKIACTSKGMTLASPEDESQQQHLNHYLRNNHLEPINIYSGYWIGSSRTSYADWFVWESSGRSVDHSGWLPGEPNGYTGENCMELKNERSSLGWNNYYCSEPKRYICEEIVTHELLKNEKTMHSGDVHEEELKMKSDREITTTTVAEDLSEPKSTDEEDLYNYYYDENYDDENLMENLMENKPAAGFIRIG